MRTENESAPTRPPLIEAQKTPVRMIMTREVFTASPEMSVEAVVALMLDEGVSRVPVVDEDGKLVGIVTKTDLVSEHFERGDTTEVQSPRKGERISLGEQGLHIHMPEALVSEVMKPATVTVSETSSVAKAAEAMAVHQLHGLPVVTSAGEVIGIVSTLDIAGWVAGLL